MSNFRQVSIVPQDMSAALLYQHNQSQNNNDVDDNQQPQADEGNEFVSLKLEF